MSRTFFFISIYFLHIGLEEKEILQFVGVVLLLLIIGREVQPHPTNRVSDNPVLAQRCSSVAPHGSFVFPALHEKPHFPLAQFFALMSATACKCSFFVALFGLRLLGRLGLLKLPPFPDALLNFRVTGSSHFADSCDEGSFRIVPDRSSDTIVMAFALRRQ
jgi:hypothetical protein